MINILVPASGISDFFKSSYYPANLYEVAGKPMIQQVIENYQQLNDSRFIFLLLQDECNRFHTDNIVSLLTGESAEVICLKSSTGGALCSCLMAIDYINNENELIISNNDQIMDEDFRVIVKYFRDMDADCGVVCFNAIHPRWSYVRVVGNEVVEAAEKRPISHEAIAGFYYFKKGSDFIDSAKNAIRKGSLHEGSYYITASINEMILQNKRVRLYNIANEKYHSFYTPERIRQYEQEVRSES